MIYRFRRKFGLPGEFRRVAREQLEAATRHLRVADIHQSRRSLKLVRALFDLARADNPIAREQSSLLRDAARGISEARDLEVCKILLTALQQAPGAPSKSFFVKAHAALDTITPPSVKTTAAAKRVMKIVESTRVAIAEWKPSVTDESVKKALKRSYRESRKAFQKAQKAHAPADGEATILEIDAEHLHTLRKRIKRLGAQLRLVRGYRPRVLLRDLIAKAADLGSTLGDEHDLAILQQKLDQAGAFRSPNPLAGFIAARRAEIGRLALEQTGRFLKERPRRFGKRIKP